MTNSPEGHQLTARHPSERVRPRRAITGMSAVLLPFTSTGEVDWPAFKGLLRRTLDAGLVPAVNMDTGYVQLLDEATRHRVLDSVAGVLGETGGFRPGSGDGSGLGFVAGACVVDAPGAPLDIDGYRREVDAIARRGGTPVVFPSFGLTAGDGSSWVEAQAAIARDVDRFIAFELGEQFAACGRVFDLATYESLLGLDGCIGAKHSSLRRQPEWDRLELRDHLRPDFLVLTGNDLAIDMVMYGSDYLLGLSAFAPDAFARRDALWAVGDPEFYELNDLLQYLGQVAFRSPVPAYKHDAARFLHLRGWIGSAAVPPGALTRPGDDVGVLLDIQRRLLEWLS